MHGSPATVVVVGASVAGVRACRALRSEGFAGRVVLVGDEDELPYDKPPLSKQYLAGSFDRDRLTLIDEAQAARAGIDMRLGTAAADLDVACRRVVLSDGSVLGYEACVIATGATARPSPWAASSGVHLLRSRTDSHSLRSVLTPGANVAVVGCGFIGAEVASTATALGCRVTAVDPLAVPIAAIVGEEVGGLLSAAHERHRVSTRFGVGVSSLDGEAGSLDLTLTDGTHLRADVAVVGIGAQPNVGWLASSGLLLEDGVVCDEYCSPAPGVYAAGDVARWLHRRHGSRVRVEHWTNAVEQAACVAHNIVHPEDLRAYEPVEYLWSDQYDLKIQVVGHPEQGTARRVVGSTSAPARFAALFADSRGRLQGAVTVNWPWALVESRRLVAAAGRLDAWADRLAGAVVPAGR
ncbi:MAG: NAD(P)/FAD-dependent oxidoreductase [Acidimicrobiales bacterium]